LSELNAQNLNIEAKNADAQVKIRNKVITRKISNLLDFFLCLTCFCLCPNIFFSRLTNIFLPIEVIQSVLG